MLGKLPRGHLAVWLIHIPAVARPRLSFGPVAASPSSSVLTGQPWTKRHYKILHIVV